MPYRNPVNQADIESALDAGQLYVPAGGGRWWLARRNGRTKTWVRTPDAFRVPIKYGLRECAAIDHTTDVTLLRIAASRVDAELA